MFSKRFPRQSELNLSLDGDLDEPVMDVLGSMRSMSVLVGDYVSLPRAGGDELVDRRSGVHGEGGLPWLGRRFTFV